MKLKLLTTTIKYVTFLVLGFLFLTSCQMTEKITINEDGSGKVSFQVDGSTIMQMMGGKIKKDEKHKKYDSIIHFRDIIRENRDSIKKLSKEKQRKLKKLENFSMRINMDTESHKMKFDMFTDFKNVKELSNMLNSFQDGFNLASKSNKEISTGKQTKALNKENTPTSKVNYSYSKRKFKRITDILDPEKLKREADSLGEAKSMFATSKYKLIYTFPKRIKNASIKDAYYSADGKTITVEKGFIEYITNPKVLDFTVEFER